MYKPDRDEGMNRLFPSTRNSGNPACVALAVLATFLIASSAPSAMAQGAGAPAAPTDAKPAATNTAAETSSGLVAQAIQLTAQGKKREALDVYLRLATADPAEGIPALGRFLGLTDFKAERAQFIQNLEDAASGIDPVTRARGLLAVGEKARAVALLRAAPGVHDGKDPKGTLLLASLLRKEGDMTDSDAVMAEAIGKAPDAEKRAFLFKEVFAGQRMPLADAPASLTLLLDLGIEAWLPTRDSLIDLIDPAIVALQSAPDYFKRRDAILAMADRRGPATAWFIARLKTREERHEDALSYLMPIEEKLRSSPVWPLLAEEIAELCRGTGRHAEAGAIFDTLAKKQTGTRHSTLALKAAGLALAQGDAARSLQLLKTIEVSTLREPDQRLYYANCLAAASKVGDIPLLIDIYNEAMEKASKEDFDLVHMIIFNGLKETEQHRALDQAIRKRMKSDPKASSLLWRLDAETCAQLRSKPNQLEALYMLVQARPNDLYALELLAMHVVPIAQDVKAGPKELLAVPEAELARLDAIAEKSLIALIKARPYDSTYYAALIVLYRSMGRENEAPAVPELVIDKDTRNARVLAVAGYALATNGYPKQGLAYYDRALALRPDDMDIRMNRAACLTRLDLWDEAEEFYRELLEHGQFGRKHHVHELIDRIWKIHQHHKTEAACLDYFRSLDKSIRGGWVDEALGAVAAQMANEGRMEVAEEFYGKLRDRAQTPAEKAGLDMQVAMMFFKADKFDNAAKALTEASARYKDDAETFVDFQQVYAELLVKTGKPDDAIQRIRRLASDHPALPLAYNALFRAGQIAETTGKLEEAKTLYQEYLKTPTTEFGRRREAEMKIRIIASGGVPPTPMAPEHGPGARLSPDQPTRN